MSAEHMTDTGGLTLHGFDWGPLTVERTTTYRGRRVLTVKTDHRHLEIEVSPQGRALLVYDRKNGRYLR